MNWQHYWDEVADASTDALAQVQRKDAHSVAVTVDHICQSLAITKSDTVLDVCCGNGLLTAQVAERCQQVSGVDISPKQIALAQSRYPHIPFMVCPAHEVSSVLATHSFTKIYLQFSFQYFTAPGEAFRVIEALVALLAPDGVIFIGDIPDRDKKWIYYNTWDKRFYHLLDQLRGRRKLGKFWKINELDAICHQLNVHGEVRQQPPHLPYAHYRFDYLITRSRFSG